MGLLYHDDDDDDDDDDGVEHSYWIRTGKGCANSPTYPRPSASFVNHKSHMT
jgi:hypothetical protein